jgi:putative DNA primase/helicase
MIAALETETSHIDRTPNTHIGTYLLDYVDAGFALVPIPAGQKGPRNRQWDHKSQVVTNREAVIRLNTGNLGLAHAYCTPTPTAALDIDDMTAAAEWFFENSIDLNSLVAAPDAVTIDSGRPNRTKVIYRLPTGVSPLPSVRLKNPTSKSTMFELRCATKNGKTVQDVLPPSIHPDTSRPYRWGGAGHFTRLPLIPDAILDCWRRLLQKESDIPPSFTMMSAPKQLDAVTIALLGQPETPRRIATVKEMLSFVNADCDYDTYREIVWAVADTGWSCSFDLLRDWSLTAPHRYEEKTLLNLLNNFRYHGGIHYGTLVHHAKKGGWHE